MPVLLSLADVRDVVIIVCGILAALFFLVGLVVTLVVGFSAKGLLNAVREMMDESIKPALASVRGAADTVRGTAEFVGKTAVAPIVRTYGAVAGVRKGLGVLAGFNKRRQAK
ncbi:MAG TPA: hypothetical protein VII57_09570 [Dehalococcoidia bacterium]